MNETPNPGDAREALGPSAFLYRALIEYSHDIVATVDVDGRLLYVSSATRRYGRDPSSLVGRMIWDFLHPDEIAAFREQFAEVSAEPMRTVAIEHRVGSDSDGWRYKETTLQNLLDEPSVRAIVIVTHDITDRKEAELQLREARDELERRVAERTAQLREANDHLERRVEERTVDLKRLNLELWEEVQSRVRAEQEIHKSELRFRSVVEDQTEFIVRWLPDGTRTFVNSSYCRFFGKSRDELIGTSFFPLILHEEDRQEVRRLARALTPENPVSSYTHRVLRPDGSIGWTEWNDRAIFDEEGKIVEYQSVGRDVTEQREIAERLQRQQEELAHVARLSVMGEMVAAIGHEIGQPLHAIATFASAAQKSLEANRPDTVEKVAEWSAKIQQQATRASEIIRRLRAFTRRTEVHREPFDLNQVARESVQLVARDVQQHRVQTDIRLDETLPDVYADRLQIEQVLVNLLRNACEAMDETPDRDRWIRIRTTREDACARVAVRDRGCGMTDQQIQSAFQAFYTTKPEGTGIGLAISRRIVEEYGGRLWAERNDEGGMTFHFTLPFPTVEEQGDAG